MEALNTASEWVKDKFADGIVYIGHKLYEWSDVALIVSIVMVLLAIFGSKRAGKGIYWTMAVYLVIQILGAIL